MEKIGFFLDGLFSCESCALGANGEKSDGLIVVYIENISPYSQNCEICGKMVVKGSTELILFGNTPIVE